MSRKSVRRVRPHLEELESRHTPSGASNTAPFGDPGADTLLGARGTDTLEGGSGADMLDGGADNDLLRGGDGPDIVYAGVGVNTLPGGNGRDRFISADEFETGDANR